MSGKRKKKTVKKSPKNKKKQFAVLPEVQGGMLLSLALAMLVSLLNFAYSETNSHWLGLLGYTLGWILTALFGLGSYIIALYIGWIGWRRFFHKSINYLILKHLYIGVLVFSTCMLLTLLEYQLPELGERIGSFFYTQLWEQKLHFHLGGAPFYYLYKDLPSFNLYRMVNSIGVGIIFSFTFITSILLLAKISPQRILGALSTTYLETKRLLWHESQDAQHDEGKKNAFLRYVKLRIPNASQNSPTTGLRKEPKSEMLAIQPEKNLKERPSLSRKEIKDKTASQPFEGLSGKVKRHDMLDSQSPQAASLISPENKRKAALTAQRIHNGDFTKYKLPATSVLTNPKQVDQSSLKKGLRRQAEVLEETLLSFAIEAKVGQINCGPTITSFEVHPAIGVKVQKVKSLEKDIALNMEARSIRILAPIPGKAAIGIEVPNPHPQEVAFKDILNAYFQSGKKFHVPVLLGKTVNGEFVMEDLAKMPHLIIAGATGSGKSVCINTIVMSILMTAKPNEIKLIMVDPKKVELTPYTKLPHMLAPVVTEPNGACAALHWLVKEMESRYEILKVVGFRNIASFNKRKINTDFESSLDREIPPPNALYRLYH